MKKGTNEKHAVKFKDNTIFLRKKANLSHFVGDLVVKKFRRDKILSNIPGGLFRQGKSVVITVICPRKRDHTAAIDQWLSLAQNQHRNVHEERNILAEEEVKVHFLLIDQFLQSQQILAA